LAHFFKISFRIGVNSFAKQLYIVKCKKSKKSTRWRTFNETISTDDSEQTMVYYLPIILAAAHKYNTLNTVIRRCLAISANHKQEYTVIAVDQALYCKLMELKWAIPEYKNKVTPRLGGLHISMNFLKVIGDHMDCSGLAEVWVESELLSPGPT
jgi:hypothetical protein